MNNTTEPTKEQMYQWYVVEKKSFRQIMKITGIKNNRKIPKLLNKYGIEIRRGSEAIKTQWINNESRRSKQGEIFKKAHEGKPSNKRLALEELRLRYQPYGIEIKKRYIKDGLTYLNCKCNKCGYTFERNLKNTSKGCLKCGIEVVTEKQRLPFEQVESTFKDFGLVLIDTDYKNSSSPLGFICPNHSDMGIQYRSYYNIQRTNGCSFCNIEEKQKEKGMSDRQKLKMYLDVWRISVFERDGYTCKCCGYNKGNILRAHHIQNFASHKHLRLDVDNGITLCKNCHDPNIIGSFHHTYGVRNNTKEQLNQYILDKQASLN